VGLGVTMVVDVFLPAAWVSCGGESMSWIVTAKFRIFCIFFFGNGCHVL